MTAALTESHNEIAISPDRSRTDSDYVFHELTRSICPACRRVIDAQILIRDNKVYMRKRCPGAARLRRWFTVTRRPTFSSRFNKPGTIPLEFAQLSSGDAHTTAACARTTSNMPASASLK